MSRIRNTACFIGQLSGTPLLFIIRQGWKRSSSGGGGGGGNFKKFFFFFKNLIFFIFNLKITLKLN
jgi:hypothetical protein